MSQPVPQINTTPLIDVLLVLLVLLVITLPHMTHRISMDLPGGRSAAPTTAITDVEVDFDGKVFWNGAPVADDQRLAQQFRAVAASASPVRILPDRHARYERVAQVLASAQRAHVAQLTLSPVSDERASQVSLRVALIADRAQDATGPRRLNQDGNAISTAGEGFQPDRSRSEAAKTSNVRDVVECLEAVAAVFTATDPGNRVTHIPDLPDIGAQRRAG